ncbi:MAG TPA: hypothetical protein VNR86_10095 [Sphingomicrobium sp.]|nr:hypothetical protein [Sphingomicrobium sp.]
MSDRTVFGKIVKWLFIGFNVLMFAIAAVSCSSNSQVISNAASSGGEYHEAATAGATIGAGLVMGTILFTWVAGDVILGLFVLFTRRKKVIEVEE